MKAEVIDLDNGWKEHFGAAIMNLAFCRTLDFRQQQGQPSVDALMKMCSVNMLVIYRRTPMPKRDFNRVTKQLYQNHTSTWVFSCKFAAYFQNTWIFSEQRMAASAASGLMVSISFNIKGDTNCVKLVLP